jgi:regulator of protease activity HflC (stomatin/prohibitin superfamily)
MNRTVVIASTLGGIFLVFLMFLFSTTYTVDQSERAVLLKNGKIEAIQTAGRYYKLPIIEDVKFVSLQTKTYTFDKILGYTNDIQPATIRISITMMPDPEHVADLYTRFNSVDNAVASLIRPNIPSVTKENFGKLQANDAIRNQKLFEDGIFKGLTAKLQGEPLKLISLQIEDVSFSDQFEKSVEARMAAEVAVQTQQQFLAKAKFQADQKVVEAKGEADSQLERAKANAQATQIQGDAEASAIKARALALASNMNLVQLEAVEKWNGILPTTMVPGSSVPFINVK